MRLPHYDWNKGNLEYFDYPDELIQPFIEYLLRKNRWSVDLETVLDKFSKLRTKLHEYRVARMFEDKERLERSKGLQEQLLGAVPGVIGPLAYIEDEPEDE